MKVGVLGTGDVGKALGKGFIALGHEVKMGSRSAQNEKALAWAKEMGPKTSTSTFADAASFGEVVVLATLGVANECMVWVLSAIRGGNWNQAFKLLRK